MNDETAALCERAQNGDVAAASELVSAHYERIFGYFRRLCGNDADAADLTQKTFAKGWQSLGAYRSRSSFSTWLHSIAHHTYVDWRRKRKPDQAQPDEWWELLPADSPQPDEDAAVRETARELYRRVDQLDDDKKQVIHLHYYQHLSISETAEALGIATSTVKYRMREALDFLRANTVEPDLHYPRRTS